MKRRVMLSTVAMAAMLALAGCGKEKLSFSSTDVTGADFGQDFRLTDTDGKERTLADFRGQVVMLFFGFTQCPDVCPTALSRAADVRKKLGPDADRLQVIFVTLDPERDSAPVLKAYTAAFDASFIGLSGDLARTQQVAEEFKVFYRKVPTGGSYTMDHTAITYVLDPRGRLRLAVRHEQTADQIAVDIRTLIRSDSPS
jgi:protein SCO1/2